MDCPVCENAMITLELSDVEIDHCTNCGGIWLDSGELEQLLGDPKKAEDVLNSFKSDLACTEASRKCPICFKKMEKIIVAQDPQTTLIDKCKKGHGLWFDKGELQNILNNAKLDKQNKIPKLLADMFGQNRQDTQEQNLCKE